MSAPRIDSDGIADRIPGRTDGPPSRYDLVLAVIPLLFVLAVVVGEVGGVSTRHAIVGAGLLGSAVLADALFVNPPRDST